ncbi:MAG: DUF2062 domain-containing protein [Cyanobacterium sp. T60_A2020_053]|nr:DUF2062 domain-containing protein [Cyanobacterium sp. T60_A2020_053]
MFKLPETLTKYPTNTYYPLSKKHRRTSLWQRYFQYYLLRLKRLREKPEAIARGFAVGVFSGSFPFFGLQMIIAILLAILFKGNKITAVMATWISNPFTYVPIFFLNFQLGKVILNLFFSFNSLDGFSVESWQNLADAGVEVTMTLLFGCTISGLILSFLTYYFSLIFLKKYLH